MVILEMIEQSDFASGSREPAVALLGSIAGERAILGDARFA